MTSTDKQRVVIVTGATGGLGKALARELNRRQISVVLCGRNIKLLEDLYDELESTELAQPAIYPVDHAGASMPDYQELLRTIETEYGRLDGLAYCAADIGRTTPLDVYPPNLWQQVMRVNCDAAFMLSTAALPLMKQTGNASIVLTIDDKKSAFWGAYACSKSALATLALVLADETEGFTDDQGNTLVTVNAVHPGRMRTRLRATAYSGELPQQSPLPETRVEPLLDILLRKDISRTGDIIYLADDVPA